METLGISLKNSAKRQSNYIKEFMKSQSGLNATDITYSLNSLIQ